ncbi:MAG TPA: hypothetical protein VK569_10525 [Bacteroidota bacterium]|nr:hypothetical protein [Bacteroidota bacterium]
MDDRKRRFGSGIVGFLVMILSLSFWGAGCSGCQNPSTVSAPASQVDVILSVSDISETPSDGKVLVVMQFQQNGTVVQLASDASTSCNGVALTYNGLVFGNAGRVPLVAAGGTYAFTHIRSGVTTNVSITVPPRPVFSPPTVDGATIMRTSSLTIHYVAGTGVAVFGGASDGTHDLNNSQPDNGTFTGLNVSGFNAGPGTLSIQRELQFPVTGTGFHSATERFYITKTAAVTWQ